MGNIYILSLLVTEDLDIDIGSLGEVSFPSGIYGDEGKIKATPIIYLYCRDDEGNKVVKQIKNFYPYFYIPDNTNIPPELHKYIVNVEQNEFYTLGNVKMKKVITYSIKI